MRITRSAVILALAAQGACATRLHQQTNEEGIWDTVGWAAGAAANGAAAAIEYGKYAYDKEEKMELYEEILNTAAGYLGNLFGLEFDDRDYLLSIEPGFTDAEPIKEPTPSEMAAAEDGAAVVAEAQAEDVFAAAGVAPPPAAHPVLQRQHGEMVVRVGKHDWATKDKIIREVFVRRLQMRKDAIKAECQAVSDCPEACIKARYNIPLALNQKFQDGKEGVKGKASCHAIFSNEVRLLALDSEMGKCSASTQKLDGLLSRIQTGRASCTANYNRVGNVAAKNVLTNRYYIPSAEDYLSPKERKQLLKKQKKDAYKAKVAAANTPTGAELYAPLAASRADAAVMNGELYQEAQMQKEEDFSSQIDAHHADDFIGIKEDAEHFETDQKADYLANDYAADWKTAKEIEPEPVFADERVSAAEKKAAKRAFKNTMAEDTCDRLSGGNPTCKIACIKAKIVVPTIVREHYTNEATRTGAKCHSLLKSRAETTLMTNRCDIAENKLDSYIRLLSNGMVTCDGNGANNVSKENVKKNKFWIA